MQLYLHNCCNSCTFIWEDLVWHFREWHNNNFWLETHKVLSLKRIVCMILIDIHSKNWTLLISDKLRNIKGIISMSKSIGVHLHYHKILHSSNSPEKFMHPSYPGLISAFHHMTSTRCYMLDVPMKRALPSLDISR